MRRHNLPGAGADGKNDGAACSFVRLFVYTKRIAGASWKYT